MPVLERIRPTLPPPPALTGPIDEAAAEAKRLGEAANILENQFRQVVAAEELEAAQNLKGQIEPARRAAALAEAQHRALAQVAAEMAKAETERARQAADTAAKAGAHEQINRATLAEATAMDEISHHMAIARAGLDAVRQSLLAAQAAEEAAFQARQAVFNARSLHGELEPCGRISRSNRASAAIDADPILKSILYQRGSF